MFLGKERYSAGTSYKTGLFMADFEVFKVNWLVYFYLFIFSKDLFLAPQPKSKNGAFFFFKLKFWISFFHCFSRESSAHIFFDGYTWARGMRINQQPIRSTS
uniref:Uncharacterized protein n=1 Tax=Cacopsylla melanoneura TaxID=428564 RepID=A0A8D8YFR5_9HEMI